MATCLIGLGSNIGNRADHLQLALEHLQRHPGISLAAVSRWHETAPVGGPRTQAPYLNGCARLETSLAPLDLLWLLQRTERELGRQRGVRFGPRTLDLDLLLYEDFTWRSIELRVPHPRMSFRRFVLEPAVEIAGEMRHPELQATLNELLTQLNELPNYVALAGPPDSDKLELVLALAQQLPAHALLAPAPELPGGHPAASDPTLRGAELHWELHWLQRRVACLARLPPRGPDQAQETWYLTPFWLPQTLVYANRLMVPQQAILQQAWQQAAQLTRPPKLLVWTGGVAGSVDGRDAAEQAAAEALEASLWDAVCRQHHGPRLELTADSLAARYTEIADAWKALQ